METISDGMMSWIGGMDSSRSPIDIAPAQYSRACNVFIPRSLGGIKVRHGIHFQNIKFDRSKTKELYEKGHIQAEGYFTDKNKLFLIAIVEGIAIKFTRVTASSFYAEALNFNDPNESGSHWVTRVPYGCIINNGVNLPLYVTATKARRTNPSKDEIGPGRMGVYVQNRFFYSNDQGNLVHYSDFNNPVGTGDQRRTGILGFQPPENTDPIIAIARQKVMLNYAEGGALVFSTRSNIYSVDVRSEPNAWADQGSRVGKVTQTVEGLSATSAYSFESFGTNLFFRNHQFGIADLRQSQYQFNNMDGIVSESIEASYWLDRDTSWMLDKCYSRSWNSRLFTTVAPEQDNKQRVFWNGLISYHPSAVYSNQQAAPRRYESVITGVRPWCITSAKMPGDEDKLFIHSFDHDGINRLYEMVSGTDYDTNHEGNKVEIEGWIETRGFDYRQRFTLKKEHKRFYSLRAFSRNVCIEIFARTESALGWSKYWSTLHKVGPSFKRDEDGSIDPVVSRPQVRYHINTREPDYYKCGASGSAFVWAQDRIQFKGPLHLDSFIRSAFPTQLETTSPSEEEPEMTMSYDLLKDFTYSVTQNE